MALSAFQPFCLRILCSFATPPTAQQSIFNRKPFHFCQCSPCWSGAAGEQRGSVTTLSGLQRLCHCSGRDSCVIVRFCWGQQSVNNRWLSLYLNGMSTPTFQCSAQPVDADYAPAAVNLYGFSLGSGVFSGLSFLNRCRDIRWGRKAFWDHLQ